MYIRSAPAARCLTSPELLLSTLGKIKCLVQIAIHDNVYCLLDVVG